MCRCVVSVFLLFLSFSVQAASVVRPQSLADDSAPSPRFVLDSWGDRNVVLGPVVVRRSVANARPGILPDLSLVFAEENGTLPSVPNDSAVLATFHAPTALEPAVDPLVWAILAGAIFGVVIATREWLARTRQSEG